MLAIVILFLACGSKSGTQQTDQSTTEQTVADTTGASKSMTARYLCPMKCELEKTYDKPGKCPKCGMDLKKLENHEGHEH